MGLGRIFLHEKTVSILLRILEGEERGEDIYPLQISNDVGSPYSYISKVLKEFEKNAIIESKFKGRIRIVKLTDHGKNVAMKLRKLKKELEKDFPARKKLSILKKVASGVNEKDRFKILAPVFAELEILERTTEDEEVLKEVFKFKKEIEGIL